MGDSESLFRVSEAFWAIMRWAFQMSPFLTALLCAAFIIWLFELVRRDSGQGEGE